MADLYKACVLFCHVNLNMANIAGYINRYFACETQNLFFVLFGVCKASAEAVQLLRWG